MRVYIVYYLMAIIALTKGNGKLAPPSPLLNFTLKCLYGSAVGLKQ